MSFFKKKQKSDFSKLRKTLQNRFESIKSDSDMNLEMNLNDEENKMIMWVNSLNNNDLKLLLIIITIFKQG